MSVIEAGARGGSIALLLLFALVALRDARNLSAARYAGAFAVGVAASLVVWVPSLAADRSLWLTPLRVLAFGNPVVFWALSRALFDDDFAPSWPPLAAWTLLLASGFWAVYAGAPFPFLPINALSLVCAASALVSVLGGGGGDLIETRRRLRVVFVAIVAAFITVTIVAVVALGGARGNRAFAYLTALGPLALSAAFAYALLGLKSEGMLSALGAAGGDGASLPAPHAPVPDDPREAALLVALRARMETDRAYRDGALTIAALAASLKVPEYRLRRLINRRLGQTNFNAFVNGYRLDETCAALKDPSQDPTPILTIALDAGFQSIGPFNRAFKARTGTTPTAFRRRRGAPVAQA